MFHFSSPKGAKPLKLSLNVRGYRSWFERYKMRSCLATFLLFVLSASIAHPSALALFGMGKEMQAQSFSDKEKEFVPIVSFYVEKGFLAHGALAAKARRYADDVQKAIGGRVLWIEVDKDVSPKDIWEGNRTLFFEGEEGVFRSRLVGTILLGDVPLPVVNKNGNLWTTVYPYTDLENSAYDWDLQEQRFVFNGEDQKPEIWHGMIRLPKLSEEEEQSLNATQKSVRELRSKEKLSAWFDRNHEYHTGVNTETSKRVLVLDNPLAALGVPADLDRKYQAFIDSIEDKVYYRFTKHWARELSSTLDADKVLAAFKGERPAEDVTRFMSDILAAKAIEASAQDYFEYYKNYLSQLMTTIGQVGRYNDEDIDTSFSLITQKDQGAALFIKGVNSALEERMIQEVKQKNVAKNISVQTTQRVRWGDDTYTRDLYWNGVLRKEMDVEDCSLLRGSLRSQSSPRAQLVEANRSFDYDTAGNCDGYAGCCANNMRVDSNGVIGLSVCDTKSFWTTPSDHRGAQKPVFSITGTREVSGGAQGASGCGGIFGTGQTFSSLMIHDEPRKETLLAQQEKEVTRALPVDSPRGFSFYDHSTSFHRLDFVDFFDLRNITRNNPKMEYEDLVTRVEALIPIIAQQKITAVNTVSGTGGVAQNIPATAFNDLLSEFEIKRLAENIVWLDLPLQQKHNLVVEKSLSEPKVFQDFFFAPDFKGYEIVQFMADSLDDPNINLTAEAVEPLASFSFLEAQKEESEFSRSKVARDVKVLGTSFTKNVASNGELDCSSLPLTQALSCKLKNTFGSPKNVFSSAEGLTGVNEIPAGVPTTLKVTTPLFIERNAASIGNIKIGFELLDNLGNVVGSDYDSLVEVNPLTPSSYDYFTVFPFEKTRMHAGKGALWLVPTGAYSGNAELQYQLAAVVNGKQMVSDIIKVGQKDKGLQVRINTQVAVTDPNGTEVEAYVVDRDQKRVENASGSVFFESDFGTFQGDNPSPLVDGFAKIRFLPGKKSDPKALIRVSDPSRAAASNDTTFDLKSGPGTGISFMEPPSFFDPQSGTVHLKVAVVDIYGNPADIDGQAVTWAGQNVGFVGYGDERRVVLASSSAESEIYVRPLDSTKDISITVTSSALNNKTGRLTLSPAPKATLVVNKNSGSVQMGLGDYQSIPLFLSLKEEEGTRQLNVFTDRKDLLDLPQSITIENGEVDLEVKTLGRAGSATITLKGDGIEQTIPVQVNPRSAEKIEFKAEPFYARNTDGSYTVWVEAIDRFGNVDPYFTGEVEIKMNSQNVESEAAAIARAEHEDLELSIPIRDYVELKRDEALKQRLFPAPEVVTFQSDGGGAVRDNVLNVALKNGKASFKVSPEIFGGKALFEARADGLVPGTLELNTKEIFPREELYNLKPHGFASYLLGFEGGKLENSSWALDWLLSGDSQSVTSLASNPKGTAQLGYLDRFGNYSDRFAPTILWGDELSFSLQSQEAEALAFVDFKTSDNNVSFDVIPKKEGVSYDDSARVLVDKNQPLVWFSKKGGVLQSAKDVVIGFDKNLFEWKVFANQRHVADIIFNVRDIELTNQNPQGQSGNFLFLHTIDERVKLVSGATGSSHTENNGVFFYHKENPERIDRLLGSPTNSIEEAHSNPDVFWQGDWKPAVLLAGGNSLGEASVVGASDALVFYGDPTLTLPDSKDKDGFDGTIGEHLGNFDEEVLKILSLDVNLDTAKDVVVVGERTIQVLYQSPENIGHFSDPEPLMKSDLIKKGNIVSLDKDQDGAEDLIALHYDGAVYMYQNQGGHFGPPVYVHLSSLGNIQGMQVGDLDGKGIKDDLVYDDALGFLWSATFDQQSKIFSDPQLMGDFAPEFFPVQENLNGATLDTAPNLLSTYIRFDGIENSVSGAVQEQLQTEVLSAVTLDEVSAVSGARYFVASDEDRVRPGSRVSFGIEISPRRPFQNVELMIPGTSGVKYDTGTLSCEGCTTEPYGYDEGMGMRITIPSVEGKIQLTWKGINQGSPGLRYTVEDFAGNDGLDDIMVAQVINGVESVVQFVSEPTVPYAWGDSKNWTAQANAIQPTPRVGDALQQTAQGVGNQVVNEVQTAAVGAVERQVEQLTLPIVEAVGQAQQAATSAVTGAVGAAAGGAVNSALGGIADPQLTTNEAINNDVAAEVGKTNAANRSFGCGDLRCGDTTFSEASTAPGVSTTHNYPDSSPGSAQAGTATIWICPNNPPNSCDQETESIMRTYNISTNTGKSGTVICLGNERQNLQVGNWTPNCTLAMSRTSAAGGSCGNQNSAQVSQAQNLHANGGDEYNSGEQKAAPETKLVNFSIDAADVGTQWVQNQYRELSNFKLPRLNVIVPIMGNSENALAGVDEGLNIENSGVSTPKRRPAAIPISNIDDTVLADFEKAVQENIKEREEIIEKNNEELLLLADNDPKRITIQNQNAEIQKTIPALRQQLEVVRSEATKNKEILGVRDSIQDIAKQTAENQNATYEMYDGWIDQIKKDLEYWVQYREDIGKMLQSWEVFTKEYATFTKNCSSCSVNRAELIEWLRRSVSDFTIDVSTYEKDGSADIFKLPRLPDITIDFSRIAYGNKFNMPEINVQEIETSLTTLPPLPRQGSGGVAPVVSYQLASSPIQIPSQPKIQAEFPRLLAAENTPEELQQHFRKEGDLFIPDVPKEFKEMQSRLQSRLGIHKGAMGKLCGILQGTEVVPEWFVRPNIELITNRQSLVQDDFDADSRNPVQPLESDQDRLQITDYNLEVDEQYGSAENTGYEGFQKSIELLIHEQQQLLSNYNQQRLLEEGAVSFASPEEFITFDEQVFALDTSVDTSFDLASFDTSAFKEGASDFKAEEWIAQLKTSNEDASRNWLASTGEPVLSAKKSSRKIPGLYYLDRETGQSIEVLDMPLEKVPVSLQTDISGDDIEELLYAIEKDVFIDYKKVPTQKDSKGAGIKTVKLENLAVSQRPFDESFVITKGARGPKIKIPQEELKPGYTEWLFRPSADGQILHRSALFIHEMSEPTLFISRPLVATLKHIRGEGMIESRFYRADAVTPEACQAPANRTNIKNGTSLVALERAAEVLFYETGANEPQKLNLKTNESVLLESGSLCAFSRDVLIHHPDFKPLWQTAVEGWPLYTGSRVRASNDSVLTLELGEGETPILSGQLYELQVLSAQNLPYYAELSPRLPLYTTWHGNLTTVSSRGLSSVPTGIYQRSLTDDRTAPTIILEGGDKKAVQVGEKIVVDARDTYDDGEILDVWWDLNTISDLDFDGISDNDVEFPKPQDRASYKTQDLLYLSLPPLRNEDDFTSVKLFVQDESGNVSSKVIQFTALTSSYE